MPADPQAPPNAPPYAPPRTDPAHARPAGGFGAPVDPPFGARPGDGAHRYNVGPHRDNAAGEHERNFAMLVHLAGLLNLVGGTILLLGLIVTAAMYIFRSKESPFANDHAREALNFQISLVLWLLIGTVAAIVFTTITFGLGLVLVLPLAVAGAITLIVLSLVGCIRGAIFASRGQYYRYPVTIRVLSG